LLYRPSLESLVVLAFAEPVQLPVICLLIMNIYAFGLIIWSYTDFLGLGPWVIQHFVDGAFRSVSSRLRNGFISMKLGILMLPGL
jgi:hypothetical protein